MGKKYHSYSSFHTLFAELFRYSVSIVQSRSLLQIRRVHDAANTSSVHLRPDNDETVLPPTAVRGAFAAADRLEVRLRGSRNFRGIGARGRPVAVVRVRAVRPVRPGLHRTVRGLGRMRSRDGRLRAGNRLRIHRAHEHARVHTGHVDAHRLPRDLSGERLLPGSQLRDGSLRPIQL